MAAQTILPGFPFPAFVNQTAVQQTVLPSCSFADLAVGGTYVAPVITPAGQATPSSFYQQILPGFPFPAFVNQTATQQTVLPSSSFADLVVTVVSAYHRMLLFFS